MSEYSEDFDENFDEDIIEDPGSPGDNAEDFSDEDMPEMEDNTSDETSEVKGASFDDEDDDMDDEDDDWEDEDEDLKAVQSGAASKNGIMGWIAANKALSIGICALAAVICVGSIGAALGKNKKNSTDATAAVTAVSTGSSVKNTDNDDGNDETLSNETDDVLSEESAKIKSMSTDAKTTTTAFTSAAGEQSDSIKALQDSVASMQSSIEAMKTTVAKAGSGAATSGLSSEVSSLSSKLNTLQSSVSALKSTGNDTSAINSLKNEVSSLQSDIEKLSKNPAQDEATKKSLSTLTSQLTDIANKVNDVSTKNTATTAAQTELANKINALSSAQTTASKDTADQIKTLQSDMTSQVNALSDKIKANGTENDTTASDLAAIKASVSALSAKVDALSAKNSGATDGGNTSKDNSGTTSGKTTEITDSNGSTTTTTTNKDGSKTTVTENKDGSTKTETTGTDGSKTTVVKNQDGSTSTTTINPDGSSTKITKNTDGSTTTEVKDADGNTITKSTTKKDSDGSTTTVTENPDGSKTTTTKTKDGTTTTKTTGGSSSQTEDPSKDKTLIAAPQAVTSLVYNGAEQTGVAEGENYTLTGTIKAVNANVGDDTYLVAATPKDGYAWNDHTVVTKLIYWSIAPKRIADPQGIDLPYNGEAQCGIPDTEGIEVEDIQPNDCVKEATDVLLNGDKEAAYKTAVVPAKNYAWADGTREEKILSWKITRVTASIELSGKDYDGGTISAYVYTDGDKLSGDDTVLDAKIIGDGDISVGTTNAKVATAKLSSDNKTLTVTPIGEGSATITVNIGDGKNTSAAAPAKFRVDVEQLYKVSVSTTAKGLILTAESTGEALESGRTFEKNKRAPQGTTEYDGIFRKDDVIHVKALFSDVDYDGLKKDESASDKSSYEFKGWSTGDTPDVMEQNITITGDMDITANAVEKLTSTDTTKDTTSSQTGSTGYKVSIYKNGTEGRPTITMNVFDLYKKYTVKDLQDTYEAPNSFYCATDPSTAKYVVYGYKATTGADGKISLTEVSSANAPVSYKDQSKLDVSETQEDGKNVWTALGLLRSGKYDKENDTYTVEYFTSDITSNTATTAAANATSAQNCYIALVPINTYTEAETTAGYNVELYKRGTISETPKVYSIEEIASQYNKDNLYKDASLSKYALYIYGNDPKNIASDGKTGFTTSDTAPVFDADSSAWTLIGKIEGAKTNASGGTSLLYFLNNNGNEDDETYAFKNDERANHFIALVPIAIPRVVDTARGDDVTGSGLTVSVYPYGDFKRNVVVTTWKDLAENYTAKDGEYYAKDSSDAKYALYTYKTRTTTKPNFDYGDNWGNWTLQGRYSRADAGDITSLHYFVDQTNGFKTGTVSKKTADEYWAALVPIENYTTKEVSGDSKAWTNYQYLDLYVKGTNNANIIVTDLATLSIKYGGDKYKADDALNAPYAIYLYKNGEAQKETPIFDADNSDWELYGVYKSPGYYFTGLNGTEYAGITDTETVLSPGEAYVALVPRKVKYLNVDFTDEVSFTANTHDWEKKKLAATITSVSKTTSESALAVHVDVNDEAKKTMTFDEKEEVVKPVIIEEEEEEEEIKVYATGYNRNKVWDAFGNNVEDGVFESKLIASLIAPDGDDNVKRTYTTTTTTTTIKSNIDAIDTWKITTLGSINADISKNPGYDLGSGAKIFNDKLGANNGKIKVAILSISEDGKTATCLPYGVGASAWNDILGSGTANTENMDLTDIVGSRCFGALYNADPTKSAISNVHLIPGSSEGSVDQNAPSEKVSGNNHSTAINVLASGASACGAFGASGNCSWLGTPYNNYAYYVYSNGYVYNDCDQSSSFVLAPVFNLDLSKVWIIDNEIVLRSYVSD